MQYKIGNISKQYTEKVEEEDEEETYSIQI